MIKLIDNSDDLDDSIFYLVMELCDNNLEEFISKKTKGLGFSE